MVVVEPPPRAPSPDELEALIEEARVRARWRRLRYAALAVATVLVGTVLYLQFGTATTRPSGSARRGQSSLSDSTRSGALVFVASGPSHAIGVDNEDLYAVGSRGGGSRNLTRTSAAEDEPAWTADGSRVVFTREYTTGHANGRVRYHAGVVLMSAGSRARLIQPCGMRCTETDFSWSPDGRQIAFVRAGAVRVMNTDGSKPRVVCAEDRCGQGLGDPHWSPDGSRLVFSNQGGILSMGIGIPPSGIWVANLDRSGVRKLTQPRCKLGSRSASGCFFDSAPSWSPDGSMIAFSRLDEPRRTTSLELMRADGSKLRSVASCKGERCNQEMAPVWSPSGKRIAFARSAFGSAIGLVSAAGKTSVIRACAGSRCVVPVGLVWAPDGRRLAFLSSGNPGGAWVIGIDGRAMHPIASNVDCCLAWLSRGVRVPVVVHRASRHAPVTALPGTMAFESDQARAGSAPSDIYALDPRTGKVQRLTRGPSFNAQPAWSPDGRRIAFAGVRPHENTNIFVANRDGTKERELTHLRSGVTEPAWSPDGRKLAVVLDRRIAILSSAGGALRTLVTGNVRDPTWSPDGKAIAFTRSRGGGSSIFTIHTDGTRLRRITKLPGTQDSPTWSPNGRTIAFVWNAALYRIAPNGTALRRVTTHPVNPGRPVWSPDGRYLAFTTTYTWHHSAVRVVALRTGEVSTLTTTRGEPSDSANLTWTRNQ